MEGYKKGVISRFKWIYTLTRHGLFLQVYVIILQKLVLILCLIIGSQAQKSCLNRKLLKENN